MPIVTRPAAESPLAQGDILKDIPFVFVDSAGVAVTQTAKYVLVLSRDCNSIRDPQVVVAPISEWAVDIKAHLSQASDEPSMDRLRRVLSGVRDGGQLLVDRFYLGCLDDGSTRRFAANLASMATVQVPQEAVARAAWLKEKRVWRIATDFGRDLHVRLFNCFAKMGFDDETWFCAPDLDMLINEGEQQKAKAQADVLAAERAIQEKEGRNENVPTKMREEVEKKKKALAQVDAELSSYVAEKARRPAT